MAFADHYITYGTVVKIVVLKMVPNILAHPVPQKITIVCQ